MITCSKPAAFGIPTRIWCDPTDLIAFSALPIAAQLAQSVQPMPARLSRRFAIGVAALACIATSVGRLDLSPAIDVARV